MSEHSEPASLPIGLLVDDDTVYLRTLQRSLARRGIVSEIATDAQSALAIAMSIRPRFVLLDLKLATSSGLDLIVPLRALRTDMRILLVTGYASVATAVEAIKRGADDYLPKPASVAVILRALGIGDLPQPTAPLNAQSDDDQAQMTPLHRIEWEHIQQALHDCAGNISEAARRLGMHRRSLQRKLAKRPRPERSRLDP